MTCLELIEHLSLFPLLPSQVKNKIHKRFWKYFYFYFWNKSQRGNLLYFPSCESSQCAIDFPMLCVVLTLLMMPFALNFWNVLLQTKNINYTIIVNICSTPSSWVIAVVAMIVSLVFSLYQCLAYCLHWVESKYVNKWMNDINRQTNKRCLLHELVC